MEERDALGQENDADAEVVDADAVGHEGFGGHLELIVVEQVEVVMG